MMLVALASSIIIFLFLVNYVPPYLSLLLALIPLTLQLQHSHSTPGFGDLLSRRRAPLVFDLEVKEELLDLVAMVVERLERLEGTETFILSTRTNLFLVIFTDNPSLARKLVNEFSAEANLGMREIDVKLGCLKGLVGGGYEENAHETNEEDEERKKRSFRRVQ